MQERYPGQANDEQTQFVIYKHWASVVPFLFVATVIFALCLAAIYYGSSHSGNIIYRNIPASIVAAIGFVGLLIALVFVLATVWVWRHNRVIVTDEHVVDITQTGLFGRRVSIVNLGSIQDVSTEVYGPMQTILHYGTITLQTAGEKEEFVMTYMPDPYGNERRIHEIHRNYREGSGQVETSPPADPPVPPAPAPAKPAENPLEKQ